MQFIRSTNGSIFCSQQKIVQTTQAIHAKLKRLNQNLIEIQFSLEMSHCKHEMLLILCWIGMASLPKPQMSSQNSWISEEQCEFATLRSTHRSLHFNCETLSQLKQAYG